MTEAATQFYPVTMQPVGRPVYTTSGRSLPNNMAHIISREADTIVIAPASTTSRQTRARMAEICSRPYVSHAIVAARRPR